MDVNTPVTNPALVAAMDTMLADNTMQTRSDMLGEMMKAHFLSPAIITPEPPKGADPSGMTTLPEGTHIEFPMLEDNDGKLFAMAFTDWEALAAWQQKEGQQTLILTFDDYAAMVLRPGSKFQGFVINPFRQNLIFNKEMVASLKEQKTYREQYGLTQQVVQKETTVQLGQPAQYPQAMVDAISSFLRTQRNVDAAYLQLMVKEGQQSYLIVVDFTGDRGQVFSGIAAAAKPHQGTMPIDMIELGCEFGMGATKDIEPFYRRKRFGLF